MKTRRAQTGANVPDAEQYARENPDCSDFDADFFEDSGLQEDEIRELIHFSRLSAE